MLPALGKTLPALETHRADFRSGPSCRPIIDAIRRTVLPSPPDP